MARKDPVAHLGRFPFGLPPQLVREVLALGTAAVDRLIAIAGDRAAWVPGAPNHVLVTNAVAVLALARDPAAVPVLVEILAEAPDGSPMIERAVAALERFAGPALVEPLLAVTNPARETDVTLLLASTGVSDPRIRDRIEADFATNPDRAAALAVRLRDPALVPAVRGAFDQLDPSRLATREEAQLAHRLTFALRALGAPDPEREDAARRLTVRAIDALRIENAELAEENRRLTALAEALETRPGRS